MDKYFALARLRSILAFRGMRGKTLQFLAGWILAALLCLFSVAVALAVGFFTYVFLLSRDGASHHALLTFVFWLMFGFGVVLPLFRGQFQEGFDCRPLLIFPLSERKLFNLALISNVFTTDHLLYYPTILALLIVTFLVSPSALLGAVIILGLFIGANVLTGFALTQVVIGVMRNRRAREMGLIFLFVVMMVFLVGLPFFESRLENQPFFLMIVAESLLGFLPPHIAGQAFLDLFEESRSFMPIGWLLAWIVVLVFVCFALFKKQLKQRSQNQGGHKGSRSFTIFSLDRALFSFLSSDVRAIVGKELRYLFRSMSGRVNFIALPAVTFLIISLIKRRSGEGFGMVGVDEMSLFGVMIYVMLLLANFINNIFAFEGAGMRAYFAGPLELSRVILGKNIGLWLYASPFPFMVLAIWSWILGFQPHVFLNALIFFALGLLVSSMLGNWLSVAFPLAKDPSSLNNAGKTSALLLGFLGLIYIGMLAFAILVIPRMLSLRLELGMGIGLLLFHIFLYRRSLAGVGEMMFERREALISAFK